MISHKNVEDDIYVTGQQPETKTARKVMHQKIYKVLETPFFSFAWRGPKGNVTPSIRC